MFPFEQDNDLFAQISSDPHQDIVLQQDPTALGQPTYFTDIIQPQDHQLPNTNQIPISANNDPNFAANSDEKKISRKEIERQRRKQMSSLHSSLRSLLPLQFVKGKRSMSDHLQEAEKYIKHLQVNVDKLSSKRDKLKSSLGSSSVDEQRTASSYDNSTNNCTVTVHSHDFGVEVVLSCANEENFGLSRVVEALVEEGFDVVSSVSVRRDKRFYTTFQCKATDFTCADLSALQHKLNCAVFSSS